MIDNGLDISRIDTTSQEEIDEFRRLGMVGRDGLVGFHLDAYSFWLEHRPDIFKLHRRQLKQQVIPSSSPQPTVVPTLGALYEFVCQRFDEGILNETRNAQRQGVTKGQILDTISAAFLHSGWSGIKSTYDLTMLFLSQYQDLPTLPRFPVGWAEDRAAFECGLDLSTLDFTAEDRRRLFGWYERTIGHAPKSVQFMARHHPGFLKAYRGKWEACFRGGLPKEMMPYFMIRIGTARAHKAGIREGALLGRAWGLGNDWIVNAITLGAIFGGGLEAVEAADEATADILG